MKKENRETKGMKCDILEQAHLASRRTQLALKQACEQKNEFGISNFWQVGHCNEALFWQFKPWHNWPVAAMLIVIS